MWLKLVSGKPVALRARGTPVAFSFGNHLEIHIIQEAMDSSWAYPCPAWQQTVESSSQSRRRRREVTVDERLSSLEEKMACVIAKLDEAVSMLSGLHDHGTAWNQKKREGMGNFRV